ncbi:MAG: hypothetical protein AUF65_02715 [Chloroflexi bacterium 13_1_20CM_50_12]|nr:MAG: hypothetical protein AUF65_02715 [Chloroflexi bacterium 13_1_20CM_50_12]
MSSIPTVNEHDSSRLKGGRYFIIFHTAYETCFSWPGWKSTRRACEVRRSKVQAALTCFRLTRLLLRTIWMMYRERRRVLRAHEKGNSEVEPNIDVLIKVLVAFRQTALELGVLMIKPGQFLFSVS